MIELKDSIFNRLGDRQKTIKFGSFIKHFAKIINDSKNLHIEHEINGPFHKPMVRMLMIVMGLSKGTDEVKWDNVDHLFLWVCGTILRKDEFLNHIYSLVIKEWFFGLGSIYQNQTEIHRFFSQSKPGNYCVHWDTIMKKFILSYRSQTDMVIVQDILKMQTINELSLHVDDLVKVKTIKDPLPTRPESMKSLKMKEAMVTSTSLSDYSFSSDVKLQHFMFVN